MSCLNLKKIEVRAQTNTIANTCEKQRANHFSININKKFYKFKKMKIKREALFLEADKITMAYLNFY
jgi:hypothetical protein